MVKNSSGNTEQPPWSKKQSRQNIPHGVLPSELTGEYTFVCTRSWLRVVTSGKGLAAWGSRRGRIFFVSIRLLLLSHVNVLPLQEALSFLSN